MSTASSTVSERRAPQVKHALLFALLAGLAVATGVVFWLLVHGSSGKSAGPGPSLAARAAFEDETGVQILRAALTGGGGIVDLRYRVIDPDKAVAVHNPALSPGIVDPATGNVVDEPFMGHRMSPRGRMRAGATYYVLLVNEQGVIDSGERVTVRLAGVGLKDVLVR